ncbi:hypothetical protein C8R45DRAFT_1107335 [Mycena sanguinolenta]|nr:hypothetical protein C8R45DRAFT_1107335 [Mycena sanguinolenta]
MSFPAGQLYRRIYEDAQLGPPVYDLTSLLSPMNSNPNATVFLGIVGVNSLNGVNGGGFFAGGVGRATANALYPKDSIIVGDPAALETSKRDLVAVFRNAVLGLRNDRAPKFMRPLATARARRLCSIR